MGAEAQPYNGEDRRRVGRDAEDSVGWVLLTVTVGVVISFVGAMAVALGASLPQALGAEIVLALLRAVAATGAVVIGALMIKRAILTGEAAPRLIGVGVLVLALVIVTVGMPMVVTGTPPIVLLVLRAAGMVTATTLLVLAARWSTIDAALRSRDVIAGAVAAFGSTLIVAVAAITVIPAGWAPLAIDVAVTAAVAGAGIFLVGHAWRHRRRLFAVGGLLMIAWSVAQLPMTTGGDELGAIAAVFDGLRLLAVVVGGVVALDDLQAAFVAQRSELLRTELDRRSVEARLQAHRERDAERAHEARSALSAIEGASSMLARYRAELDEDGRVALTSAIQAEIQRLQRLVDASEVAEPASLHLARLVEGEVALSAQQDSDIHVHVPDDLWVFAERDAVLGILRNLLVNARTHAPGAAVWVSATPAGSHVELRVSDDGPGLSREDLTRAFERGHRGAGAESRPGSGLGLHVARGLAVRNGGTLMAETGQSGGATFVLRLPSAARSGELPEQVDEFTEVGELGGAELS